MRVNDAILGRAYTSSTITDASVAAAAARATKLLEQLHDAPDAPSAPDAELAPPVTPSVPSYGIFSYAATWLYLLGAMAAVLGVVIGIRLLRGR